MTETIEDRNSRIQILIKELAKLYKEFKDNSPENHLPAQFNGNALHYRQSQNGKIR